MTADMVTTANSNDPILEACAIGRQATRSEQWLIRDINLKVCPGNRLAIVGPSGSGKSVLLRALCLLDPLDAGSILWNTKSIQHSNVPEFRGHVMYLRQQPSLLEGNVEDNLRQPYFLKAHRDKQFDADKIVRLLQRLDRDESFLRKQCSTLSGGESQIVALLRAIQLEPNLLLLDEPTSALDSDTTALVERLASLWMQELPDSRASVWVSHDESQAERVADSVFRIDRGLLDVGH
jgi:putative ABC transport system ATP-binding protein